MLFTAIDPSQCYSIAACVCVCVPLVHVFVVMIVSVVGSLHHMTRVLPLPLASICSGRIRLDSLVEEETESLFLPLTISPTPLGQGTVSD